jgi:hypothetical protein
MPQPVETLSVIDFLSSRVVRDENGNVNSVRYDQVDAMLLNEWLKEHRKNQDQKATISELEVMLAESTRSGLCSKKRKSRC